MTVDEAIMQALMLQARIPVALRALIAKARARPAAPANYQKLLDDLDELEAMVRAYDGRDPT